jgi:hypothetical protein
MKLNEIYTAIPFEILEANEIEENGKKKFRVKGIFNRADERNANNRIYPSRLLEREHGKLNERLAKKESIFMQADHPSDGVSRIGETGAIMRSVHYDPKTKLVTGEADILSTHKGQDLQEIIRAGGQVGISARGFGTTSPGEHAGQKGDVVNEDYNLLTYDFVIGQSTRGAIVSDFQEQARLRLQEEMEMDLKTLDLETLKAGRPDLIAVVEKAATEAAKAESAKTLEALVKSQTEEIEKRLRADLKLEKKGAKSDDDEDDMKEMIAAAKRHGYVVSDATRPGDARYGGGKGRSGKGREDSEGSDADSQESSNGPSEQEMLSFFQKNNVKVEKKAAKNDDKDDVEERFGGLQAQIRDLQKVNEQTSNRAKQLEESARTTEIKSYIFEKVKDERKYKNALTERLLGAALKTREEVDKRWNDPRPPDVSAKFDGSLLDRDAQAGR